jgi:hypothetical protein
LGRYHEQHIINGYIEKYLKAKQKIFVSLRKLKKFMKKTQIRDTEESRMILSDIMT